MPKRSQAAALCCPHCRLPLEQMILDIDMTISCDVSSSGFIKRLRDSDEELLDRAKEECVHSGRLFCEHCDRSFTFTTHDNQIISILDFSPHQSVCPSCLQKACSPTNSNVYIEVRTDDDFSSKCEKEGFSEEIVCTACGFTFYKFF